MLYGWIDATFCESKTDHTRNNKKENRKQFQKAREHRTTSCFFFVGCSQHTLNNVLVGTPVPQANNRRTKQHAGPGIFIIKVPCRSSSFLDWCPRSFCVGWYNRLP